MIGQDANMAHCILYTVENNTQEQNNRKSSHIAFFRTVAIKVRRVWMTCLLALKEQLTSWKQNTRDVIDMNNLSEPWVHLMFFASLQNKQISSSVAVSCHPRNQPDVIKRTPWSVTFPDWWIWTRSLAHNPQHSLDKSAFPKLKTDVKFPSWPFPFEEWAWWQTSLVRQRTARC